MYLRQNQCLFHWGASKTWVTILTYLETRLWNQRLTWNSVDMIMSQLQASYIPLRWNAWILALLGFMGSAVWCSWLVRNTQWCYSKVNTVDHKDEEREWKLMIKVLTSMSVSLKPVRYFELSMTAFPFCFFIQTKVESTIIRWRLRPWWDHNIGEKCCLHPEQWHLLESTILLDWARMKTVAKRTWIENIHLHWFPWSLSKVWSPN